MAYRGAGQGSIQTHDYPCPTSPAPATTLQPDFINYWIESYAGNCCNGFPGTNEDPGLYDTTPIIMYGAEKWNGSSWVPDGTWSDSGPLSAETWTYKSISVQGPVESAVLSCGEDICYRWSSKMNRFTENEWTGFLMTGYTPPNWPITGKDGVVKKYGGYLWTQQGKAGQARITGYTCCGVSETMSQGFSSVDSKKCFPDGSIGYPEPCVTQCPTPDLSNCNDLVDCSPSDRSGGTMCLDEFPCCATCPPCTTVPPGTTSVPPTTCPPCDCDCPDPPACDEWGTDGQCILFNGKKYKCVPGDGEVECTLCPEVGDIPAYWQEIICTTIAPTTPLPTTCDCNIPAWGATPDPDTMCRNFSNRYYKGDCQTIYNTNTSQWELWQVSDSIGTGFTTVSAWMSANCTDPSLGGGYWELVEVC